MYVGPYTHETEYDHLGDLHISCGGRFFFEIKKSRGSRAGSPFKALVQRDSKSKIEFGSKKHVTERPPESICITKTKSETKYFSFEKTFSERLTFFEGGRFWLN